MPKKCKKMFFQPCYSQTPWTSGPKFCIQLVKHQGHLHAKFQPKNQMISRFFGLKRPQKCKKMVYKPCYSQMPWTSGPKFGIQLVKHQGHLHAKFQPKNQIISRFFGLKRPKKCQKNAKKCFFSHAIAKRLKLVAQNFAYSLSSTRAILMPNFSLKIK